MSSNFEFENFKYDQKKEISKAVPINIDNIRITIEELDYFLIKIILDKDNLSKLTMVNNLSPEIKRILSFFSNSNNRDFSNIDINDIKSHVRDELNANKSFYHFLAEALLGIIFEKYNNFSWTSALIDYDAGLTNTSQGVDACLYNLESNQISLGEAKFYESFSNAINKILENFIDLTDGKINDFLTKIKNNDNTNKIVMNILDISQNQVLSLTKSDLLNLNFSLFGFVLHDSKKNYDYSKLKEKFLRVDLNNQAKIKSKSLSSKWNGNLILIHLPISNKIELISKFIKSASVAFTNLANEANNDNKLNLNERNKEHLENIEILERRKSILNKLDRRKNIPSLEKLFYGLTPYVDWTKINVETSSFVENIFLLNQKSNVIQHLIQKNKTDRYYFMLEQQNILNLLRKYKRILFSAPTSFGKTLLIKELIFTESPNYVVFIVPTNSLAMELEKSFKNNSNFKDYTIFDSIKEDFNPNNLLKEKWIFIGTQEKYHEFSLRVDQKIDFFIIDEAYKLSEKTENQRNYILSKTFLKSIKSTTNKIFLLSPNANFIGFEKFNFEIISTNFNSVDKNFYLEKNKEDLFNKLKEVLEKKQKTIFFCNSPNDIIKAYKEMDLEISFQIKNNDLSELIQTIDEIFHPDWIISKFLKKGILVHHGKIPKFLQRKILFLFKENPNYYLLIGTNSISEGINTPTKNLFIDPNYSFRKNNESKMLIKNTIGRAGRLGEYPIGKIFSIREIDINENVDIQLAVSDDLELENVDETQQDKKIEKICEKNSLDSEKIKQLLKKYNWSAKIFSKILFEISIEKTYPNFVNIIDIYFNIFLPKEKWKISFEKIYLNGFLLSFYKKKEEDILLNNYQDRIDYFKFKNSNLKNPKKKTNNSEIMDGFMNMRYSFLEYNLLPFSNFFFDLIENDSEKNLKLGSNVREIFNNFKNKYILNFESIEELNDDEKIILKKLNEYGIPTKKIFDKEKISEINLMLGKRYSMFDISKVIKDLSSTSKLNHRFYKTIWNKYIK